MAKGTITHVEFPADDPERAKRFYAAVAGWEFSEMPEFPNYFLFRTEEGHGGGLGQRGQSVGQVVRLYITVDNLEDACAAAEANGGTILQPPTDIPGQGRYAAMKDTEGSEIGLWENPR
ncbi:MAG TPA: VOC family protein [Candidatus Limnocylindrales bacterium]|nr:VOC family protein [Candidatus Limnocylindrales bacterium]